VPATQLAGLLIRVVMSRHRLSPYDSSFNSHHSVLIPEPLQLLEQMGVIVQGILTPPFPQT
jgi:hypothetical protein